MGGRIDAGRGRPGVPLDPDLPYLSSTPRIMTDEDLDLTSGLGPPGAGRDEASRPAPPAGTDDRLRTVLRALRDELGFETASLFVPDEEDGGSWVLAARSGPVRSWHPVIDPEVIEGLSDGGIYADARHTPGVGLRLSGLGCGSLAVFRVSGGACLVLDAAFPKHKTIEPPDEDLLQTLEDTLGTAVPPPEPVVDGDLRMVRRMADTTARVIEAGEGLGQLLTGLRQILGARGLAMVTGGPEGLTIARPADEDASGEVTSPIQAILRILPPTNPIPEDLARRLAGAVGLAPETARAAYCRADGRRELIVCSWDDDPDLPQGSVRAAARFAGIARAAGDLREDAIERYLEPERARWAHEIHDGITQAVTAAVIQIENLRGLVESNPAAASEALEEAQQEIRRSLNDLRGVMADLSETGTVGHPAQPLEQMISDVVQRWRLPARISVSGEVSDVSRQGLSTALVVVREALTNAAKHSGAKHVNVDVAATPDGLTAVVTDNGRGFDPRSVERQRGSMHLGLRLMRRRVADAGGTIEITSAPGAGTKVTAAIPARPEPGDPGRPRRGSR